MSLRFWNKTVAFPLSACWTDPPDVVAEATRGANKGARLPHATKGRPRPPGTVPRGLVVHTTSGTARAFRPGLIASTRDWLEARFQATTTRSVSWHCTIDLDGSVLQHAGPDWTCWHASQANAWADGFELVQGPGGVLTGVQLAAFVMLFDVWTRETGIPRDIAWRGGKPFAGMLTRALETYGAGRTLCLTYGHRNIWHADGSGHLVPYRGPGDPSDLPFLALRDAGYRLFDVEAGEDLAWWKGEQARRGLDPDGVAYVATRRALLADPTTSNGQLVARPGDATAGTPAWAAAV